MIQLIHQEQKFEIEQKSDFQIAINNENQQVDFVKLPNGKWHLLFNNQSFDVDLISHLHEEKQLTLKLNQQIFNFNYKTETDLLLEAMGFESTKTKVISNFKAPMPGLVVDILVKEGDNVNKGDKLLVLEAMKMENILKAPADVVIKKLHLTKGLAVEKNQVLIEFV